MLPRRILVYGSRVFGQIVKDLVAQCGYEFAGFIDDIHSGAEVLGGWDAVCRTHPPSSCALAVAIGYQYLQQRHVLSARAIAHGYAAPALIHPHAYVRAPAAIGAGAIVMAGAVVDIGASVGEFAVIWPGATINHGSHVGANTFVSPNAVVCGLTTVGEDCFVGAGAVIVDHQIVPAGSFIKAGSVYVHAG